MSGQWWFRQAADGTVPVTDGMTIIDFPNRELAQEYVDFKNRAGTLPPELPALLHSAYVISFIGQEKALELILSGEGLGWRNLEPETRKAWEEVAKQAVEFHVVVRPEGDSDGGQ